MDNWTKLKKLYVNDHLAKDLAKPEIRLNAVESLEKLMRQHLPEFVKQPKFMKQIDKKQFVKMLEIKKGSKLNGAQESVINGFYKFLPEL